MPDIYTIFTRPITGALGVSGSIYLPASQRLFGTASQAITSSYALTASVALNLPSNIITSSQQINTGSFSGSFVGVFTGSMFGTSSWASNAVSSSFATTASFAPYGGLRTKSGNVTNTSFAGSPRKATVTFATAFPNTSYSITITGEDSRAWSVESKLAGSFVINANSNTALAGTTYWIATAYGET